MKAPPYRVQNPVNSYDSLLEVIKANILARRMQLGWTQRQFAYNARCSQRWINLMEKGDYPVRLEMLCRAADVLGTTVAVLHQPGAFGAPAAPQPRKKAKP